MLEQFKLRQHGLKNKCVASVNFHVVDIEHDQKLSPETISSLSDEPTLYLVGNCKKDSLSVSNLRCGPQHVGHSPLVLGLESYPLIGIRLVYTNIVVFGISYENLTPLRTTIAKIVNESCCLERTFNVYYVVPPDDQPLLIPRLNDLSGTTLCEK